MLIAPLHRECLCCLDLLRKLEPLHPQLRAAYAGVPAVSLTLPMLGDRLELRVYEIEDVPRIHGILYGNEEARRLTGGVFTIDDTRTTIEG